MSAVNTVDAYATQYPIFLALLRAREGDRHVVYLDSNGHPTGGTGHLILPSDRLRVGDPVSPALDDAWLEKDAGDAWWHGEQLAAQAGITSPAFMPFIASVCYQLGDQWTREFPNTWGMICRGQYSEAAQAVLYSEWADETPIRAEDFAAALRALPPKGQSVGAVTGSMG